VLDFGLAKALDGFSGSYAALAGRVVRVGGWLVASADALFDNEALPLERVCGGLGGEVFQNKTSFGWVITG
jgi:hypothetical protein